MRRVEAGAEQLNPGVKREEKLEKKEKKTEKKKKKKKKLKRRGRKENQFEGRSQVKACSSWVWPVLHKPLKTV